MLHWTFIFLILSLVAGLLGFTGMAGTAATIAQIMSVVFFALLVTSIFANTTGRSS